MAASEGTPSRAPATGPGSTAFRAPSSLVRRSPQARAVDQEETPVSASRLRIPLTADPFANAAIASGLVNARGAAVAHLFTGMAQVHTDLSTLVTTLQQPVAPPNLIGILVQP